MAFRTNLRSKWRPETPLDLYDFALGFFLFLSPWLFAYAQSTSRMEAWATGLAVMLASGAAIVAFSEWKEWVLLLLGVWLIVAPWMLDFTHTTAMHVSIGVGIVVVYLTLLDLLLLRMSSEPAAEHQNSADLPAAVRE